jgi:L-lactate utilization protein LutB
VGIAVCDLGELEARFLHNLRAGDETHGTFAVVEDVAAAAERVARIVADEGITSWAVSPESLSAEVADRIGVARVTELGASALASCPAALCQAAFVVGETASIALSPPPGWARAAWYLPPVQIVLARASEIVPTLAEGLSRIGQAEARYHVLVTGPSRTADVEKTVVIPAHGPKRMHLVIVRSA